MNRCIAAFLVFATLFLAGCASTPPTTGLKQTFSSFDLPSDHPPKMLSADTTINLQGAQLDQVLKVYQELSDRTVIHGPLPATIISLRSQSPLNRIQALQMLDTVLAQNNITMVPSGDRAVKAEPTSMAVAESPPNIPLPWDLLPDSSSFMTRTVQLKNVQAQEAAQMLAPLAKLPNSILANRDHNLLVLRDYSSNIRAELQLLEELEQKQ